ncbi:protein tramtrack, beta isoform-like isoform X3 [Chrysoperla carnea]|uniref:protein tramtrack, beta isoform-like isoform X3 n=1 Tax=Chrysoperla carnea TaxID=189513 RepID=UPI001D08F486|nr:protein tramtrack, beta isoform-like isoform X3 [Chrysoperla carnea]
MAVQQFCLRWNNHQPNFISVFSSLLNSESLVDVTLAAEGRHLQAHKVVLSACSSYFQSLFMVNPCQHPIVILKDVKFMDLKIMVDFMYYGEVNVSQEQLPHILKTAEMLKIKGLAEMPDSTSLTKSQNNSTEKTDLLTPGESNWSSDGQRLSSSPSSCPLSPGSRRKRLRKSSSGSGSASTERTSEDQPGDMTSSGNVTGVVTKTEPNSSFSSEGSVSHISTLKQHSSESEIIRNNSQESIEEERHTQQSAPTRTHVGLQMPQPEIQTVVQQPIENPILDLPDPSSSGTTCVQQTPVHQDKSNGAKRGRLLIRQPRIKKYSDSSQQSPEGDLPSPQYLNLPPIKIERQCSEPSPHLLSVPRTSTLVKQHSHPLLPSQIQQTGKWNGLKFLMVEISFIVS